jgi:hypothetical protein
MSGKQWAIAYKEGNTLKLYATAYTAEQIREAREDCRAKYGNVQVQAAEKFIPVHE